MPPKRRRIDEDYVKPESYQKRQKIPPPEPWELPLFEPLLDLGLQEQGNPVLPLNIDPTAPEQLFDLLFDFECVELIVQATNRNAAANPPRRGPLWRDLTPYELYGYIGVLIYASVHQIRNLDHL
jgi:hypothetical protein